jgi:hypothetical protein
MQIHFSTNSSRQSHDDLYPEKCCRLNEQNHRSMHPDPPKVLLRVSMIKETQKWQKQYKQKTPKIISSSPCFCLQHHGSSKEGYKRNKAARNDSATIVGAATSLQAL